MTEGQLRIQKPPPSCFAIKIPHQELRHNYSSSLGAQHPAQYNSISFAVCFHNLHNIRHVHTSKPTTCCRLQNFLITTDAVAFTIAPLTGPTISASYYSSYFNHLSEVIVAAASDRDAEWASSFTDARLDAIGFVATQTTVSITTTIRDGFN